MDAAIAVLPGGQRQSPRAVLAAVDGDQTRWTPRTTVVFAGAVGDVGCPSADRCCGYINFFAMARTARSWAGRHPDITGTIMRRAGALRFGIAAFGALLHPADGDTADPEQ